MQTLMAVILVWGVVNLAWFLFRSIVEGLGWAPAINRVLTKVFPDPPRYD